MLNRRQFMASTVAAGALGLLPVPGQRAFGATVPQEYLPRQVRLTMPAEPGEIHVDPNAFKLYWTLPGGTAIQYTVGVGREGLYDAGTYFIGAKKEWPSWTPTQEMIAREPELYAEWAGGMPGGPENPLGARALYLFTEEQGDTFLRIHGTGDPRTIGMAVSNGCTRLVNDHVIDLYNRVPLGSVVVLHPKTGRGRDPLISSADGDVEPPAQDEPAAMCRDVLGRMVRCNP